MIVANRAGEDPYATIPSLVERFIPQCRHVPLNAHPSPHPISMAALTSPLAGILSYSDSYTLWAAIEGLALVVALLLFTRIPSHPPSMSAVLFTTIALLSAFTSFDDIFLGQVNFTLLALFAAGILLLKRNELVAGLLFGIAIAIKFFGWPVALLFLLKRRWRASAGLIVGFALVQAMSIGVAGFETTRRYFVEVVPAMTNFYASCGLNQSLRSLPQHLFAGYSEHCYNWPDDGALSLPFFDSPLLLSVTHIALPLCLCAFALYFILRTPRLTDALIATICFSVIASPVVWGHAAVLTYIVLASLFNSWSELKKSPAAIAMFLAWILGVFIIPTFVPGSPNRDLLAALHNISVSISALSATALALWLPVLQAKKLHKIS